MTRSVRGVRDSIPGGTLLGRDGSGKGPAGIVTMRQIAVAVAHFFKGGSATSSTGALLAGEPNIDSILGGSGGADGFGFSNVGLLTDGEFLGSGVWGYAMKFPSTKNVDEIVAEFAPESDAVFDIVVGATVVGDTVSGGTTVGTIKILAGHKSGAVSWMSGAGYTLTAGTPLVLVAPSPNDATLYGVTAAIYGDRS